MNVSATGVRLRYGVARSVVVASLVLLSRSDWVLFNLYHGDLTVASVSLALLTLFAAVLLTLIPVAMLLPAGPAEVVLRILAILVAAYIFQPVIRTLPIFPAGLTPVQKVAFAICAVALAWWTAVKLSQKQWRRMQFALLFGGMLFVAFPMLAVQTTAQVHVRVSGDTPVQGATVLLLLDELNVEAGQQIAAAITKAGGAPRLHQIKAVGNRTDTVIPELFGGPHVPNGRVCTPTAVCDTSRMFDFSRLHFEEADRVHIVGFHHPYCAANGLASCARFSAAVPSAFRSLLCSFNRLLPAGHFIACDWAEPNNWHTFRMRVRDAALQSPFWQGGGTLYAHLPFPHPPGQLLGAGLAADYADNVQLAGQIAAQFWRQGRERFGPDFRFIVLSDHPLRPALWCGHVKYYKTGCAPPPRTAFEGQVPYIVVGNRTDLDVAPSDNAMIFTKSKN